MLAGVQEILDCSAVIQLKRLKYLFVELTSVDGILATHYTSTGGTTGEAEGGVRPPKPPGELRGGASGLVAGRTLADAMLCSRYLHGHS